MRYVIGLYSFIKEHLIESQALFLVSTSTKTITMASLWVDKFKSIFIPFVSIILVTGFVVTGIILVLLQITAYLLLRPWNLGRYRKICYFSSNFMFWHKLFLVHWWTNTEIQVFLDPRDLNYMGKEHSIFLLNHKYETDILITTAVCSYLGIAGNTKTIAKKCVQYLPIFGWLWKLQEHIFLNRNFEKDKIILETQLASLLKHGDPFNLLLFAEGTRFTKDKHKVSMALAKEKGLQELRHLLLPRTNGFVKCVQALKSETVPAAVYDGLVVLETGENGKAKSFSFAELMKGYGPKVTFMLKRYPLENISGEDAECARWLHERYQEKDVLLENFLQTGKFGNNELGSYNSVKLTKPVNVLVVVAIWDVASFILILWLLIKLLVNGNMYMIGAVIALAYGVDRAFRILNDLTKIEKASLYGQ